MLYRMNSSHFCDFISAFNLLFDIAKSKCFLSEENSTFVSTEYVNSHPRSKIVSRARSHTDKIRNIKNVNIFLCNWAVAFRNLQPEMRQAKLLAMNFPLRMASRIYQDLAVHE